MRCTHRRRAKQHHPPLQQHGLDDRQEHAPPGHGRCVSIFLGKSRCHIGRSQSKQPPKRAQRPPHPTRRSSAATPLPRLSAGLSGSGTFHGGADTCAATAAPSGAGTGTGAGVGDGVASASSSQLGTGQMRLNIP
jgi:hypothetical protein